MNCSVPLERFGPENFPIGVTYCCGHSEEGGVQRNGDYVVGASSLRFRWGSFWGSGFRFGIIDQHGDCGDGELGMRALVIASRLNKIIHIDVFNEKRIL